MATLHQALSNHISLMQTSFVLSASAVFILVLSQIKTFKGSKLAIVAVSSLLVLFSVVLGLKSSRDFSLFLRQLNEQNKNSEFFSIPNARTLIYITYTFNLIVIGIFIAYLAFFFLGSETNQ